MTDRSYGWVVLGAAFVIITMAIGTLFTLVLVLGLSQVDGEATSLLAILPVAFVGTWRQQRYGNVRLTEGLAMGALAAAGTVGGVALVNVLPAHTVKLAFAALLLVTAFQMVRRAVAPEAAAARGEDRS